MRGRLLHNTISILLLYVQSYSQHYLVTSNDLFGRVNICDVSPSVYYTTCWSLLLETIKKFSFYILMKHVHNK